MSTKVITGKVRFSFVHIFEKHAVTEKDTPQYSIQLLIPKNTKEGKATYAKIMAAVEAAKEIGKSKKWNGKIPKKIDIAIYDADDEEHEEKVEKRPELAGHWFLSAKSKEQKPGIVDADLNDILDKFEVKSGDYGKASISAFAYEASGKPGVSFGLNNVMLLEDGESLGGGKASAESDFADDKDDL